jgi:hypothetical protein
MTKRIISFLILTILLTNCEKSDLQIDPEYPTTIFRLSDEKLLEKRTEFALKNKYIKTSLDEFGFCGYADGFDLLKEYAPDSDSISEQTAIDLIKKFIKDNPKETGVNNVNDFLLLSVKNSSPRRWYAKSMNQKIDTIEVINSKIIIDVYNGYIGNCLGNWYPEIFIPARFNIELDEAKHYLIGKQVTHHGIGDESYTVTITKQDILQSRTKLIIIPIRTDTKIELRVAWLIYMPNPVNYNIYIDVMTKKIIYQDPTIIIM